MKIAVVVGGFPILSETFIVNQIVHLINEGHEVKIFSYQHSGQTVLQDDVIKYNLMDKCSFYYEASPVFYRRLLRALLLLSKSWYKLDWGLLFRSLKGKGNAHSLRNLFEAQWFLEKGFDIIHVHFAPHAKKIARLKQEGILKNPYIVSFHGYDLPPADIELYTPVYKQIFETCHYFTVNTPYTGGILRKIYSGKNVCVLPESLDTQKFTAIPCTKNEKFTLIYCGRLVPFKGGNIAIETIHELVNNRNIRQIELRLIGDGGMKEELESLIMQFKLAENVKLLGPLKQSEIVKEMSAAHAFFLPGITEAKTLRAENQGLVVQEAQSIGLPVIVSTAGGMKDGVIDGENGYIVDERNVRGFADKIELLYTNEALRVQMGENGVQFARNTYDISILGKQLTDLYQNCIIA